MNPPANEPVTNAPAPDSDVKDSVVPIWLIIVLFLLVYWGAVYFDERGGWFARQVYAPYRSSEDLANYNAAFGPPDIKVIGGQIYGRTCVACHQPNGLGLPGQCPSLVGSDFVNEKDPGRIIRIVLQGFSGTGLVVNGQPINAGTSMVAWGGTMSDDEIAAVISYVRGAWGNKAPPITPEQVKSVRGKVASHPGMFSPDEIMKISPSDL